jgi:hypothetical protein
MKTLFLTLFLIASFTLTAAGRAEKTTVNGVVFENVRGFKVPLSLASVQCKGTTIGTFSTETGDFKLDLPDGTYKVTFSFAGYKPVEKELKIKASKPIYIEITLDQNSGLAQN